MNSDPAPRSRDDDDVRLHDSVEEILEFVRRGGLDKSGLPELPQSAEEVEELAVLANELEGALGAETRAPDTPLLPRQLGPYQIIRMIGRGGMGIVCEARHVELDKAFAIKILPRTNLMKPQSLIRFQSEARAAARLDHPNIIGVVDVGNVGSYHYYVMQYIDGCDLAEIVQGLSDDRPPHTDRAAATNEETRTLHGATRDEPAGETLAGSARQTLRSVAIRELLSSRTNQAQGIVRFICDLGIQAASALHHAHQHGVVHRDIKPSNLLLDFSGKLWVVDFGLAHIEGSPELTSEGELLGTLRYMSPEQALAKRVVIDERTDIYSLGITLYELLARRPAFDATDREQLLRQVAFEDPPPLRRLNASIPAELSVIIAKATSKNPDDRYETAEQLAADLKRLQDGQPVKARPISRTQVALRWAHGNLGLVLSLAAGFFLLAVLAGAMSAVLAHDNATVREMLQRSEGLRLALHSRLQLEDDPGTAYLLAKEALARHESPEVRAAALAAWAENFEQATLAGHAGPVTDLSVSADGRHIVSCDQTGEVRVWDGATGQFLRTLGDSGEPRSPITQVLISPDNGRVLTMAPPSSQGEFAPLAIWDVTTGRQLRVVPQATPRQLHRRMLSANGSKLVFAARNSARLVDAIGGQLQQEFPHPAPVLHALLTPDASRVITLAEDGKIRIWNAGDGTLDDDSMNWSDSPSPLPREVDLTPDGTRLVTAAIVPGVRLWNLETRELVGGRSWPGDRAVFTADGAQLLSYRTVLSGTVEVRDIHNAGLIAEFDTGARLVQVVPGPANQLVAAVTADQRISVWSRGEWKRLFELRGHRRPISVAAFTPAAATLVSAGRDRTVRLWDLQRALGHTLPLDWQQNSLVYQPSSDGKTLLVGAAPLPQTSVIAVDTGQVSESFAGRALWTDAQQRYFLARDQRLLLVDAAGPEKPLAATSFDSPIAQAEVSPDHQTVAVALENRSVWICRLLGPPAARPNDNAPRVPGLEKTLLIGSETAKFTLRFRQDSKQLAVGTAAAAEVFEVPTGQRIARIPQVDGAPQLRFQPQAGNLLIFGGDAGASLWSLPAGTLIRHFTPPGQLRALQAEFVTPQRLLTFGHDQAQRTLTVWDVEQDQPVNAFELGSRMHLATADFSEVIAIGSGAGVFLWNPRTDERPEKLTDQPVESLALCPNQRLVTVPRSNWFDPRLLPTEQLDKLQPPKLRVWNLASRELEATVPALLGKVTSLRWMHDRLVAHHQRHDLLVVSSDDNRQLQRLSGGAGAMILAARQSGSHTVAVTRAGEVTVWNDDGSLRKRHVTQQAPLIDAVANAAATRVATADAAGELVLWELPSGKVLARQNQESPFRRLAFTADGSRLFSVSQDAAATIWDADTGQPAARLTDPQGILAAQLAPNGQDLAYIVGSYQPSVLPGQPATPTWAQDAQQRYLVRVRRGVGGPLATFPVEARPLLIQFAAQGQLLLVVTDDRKARVWKLAEGTVAYVLGDADHLVEEAMFDPTGRYLATIARNEVAVYQSASGELLYQLPADSLESAQRGRFLPRSQWIPGPAANQQWFVAVARMLDGKRLQKWPVHPKLLLENRPGPRVLSEAARKRFQLEDR